MGVGSDPDRWRKTGRPMLVGFKPLPAWRVAPGGPHLIDNDVPTSPMLPSAPMCSEWI